MNRDEFFDLVCDGETLDTDTVMAAFDALRAELERVTAERDALMDKVGILTLEACKGSSRIDDLHDELDALKEALRGLLQTIDRATTPDLHHHMCPKWANQCDCPCDCGADESIRKARARDRL